MKDDPLDKLQPLPVARDEVKIPTEAEHRAFIRRLWKTCIAAAIAIFVVTGGVVLALFLKGHDSKKIVEVSTAVFQVLVLSYGMGFFVPAFLTSLINMALGVKMSRKGLEIGQETANVLERVDDAIEKRLARVDKLIDSAERVVEEMEKGEGPLLKVFREEMEKLRKEVKGARESTETEMSEALDQGEIEAGRQGESELEDGPPCGKCERPTKRPVNEPEAEFVCPNPDCF